MAIRITCINKDYGNHENPYTAITFLGWVNEETNVTGKSGRLIMYDYVKNGNVAFVEDSFGNVANIITAETTKGTRYVKTKADDVASDNLLKLPECKI